MRSLRAVAPALFFLVGSHVALADSADVSPSADLRGYRVPMDPRAGMYVEPATTADTGDFAGGVRLNYAFRPIVLRDASGARKLSIIEHQLTGDIYATMGFFKRFALGVDLPAVIAQVGDDPSHDALATAAVGTNKLTTSALGDPGVDVKITLVQPPAEDRGAAIAIFNRLTIPIGDPTSFLGEGTVTDEIRSMLDAHFAGMFTVHATAGVKLRGDEAAYGCGATPLDQCMSRFGHELLWGAGLEVNTKLLKVPNMAWFAELRGYLPITPIHPFQSRLPSGTFLSVSARYSVRDVTFFAGPEIALDKGIGNAPLRVTLGVSFAPRSHDRDGDGVDDEVDRCPDRAGDGSPDGCPHVNGNAPGGDVPPPCAEPAKK